jgi:Flp pilus assembly protein TadD
MNDQATSLRPLRAVDGVISSLRDRVLDGTGTRRATLQVADAVETSLRYLLRDDPGVPMPVRLRALAPDELSTPELLAELRQNDRISMELAASVHELFEARRRLEQGSSLGGEDAPLALRVADRLEAEVLHAAPLAPEALYDAPPAAAPGWEPAPLDAAPPAEPGEPTVRMEMRRRWPWMAGAGVVAAALLAALLLLPGDRGDAQMEQGIALFRSGAYADAAAHFWRYAEANPDDPTPHLYLARIHRRMGRPEMAGEELQKAIALAPDDADVHSELGFLLLDTGRAPVAVERFRAALRLDPESAEGWIGLVRALRAAGRADAAERVLSRAPAEVREMFARRTAAAPRP